MPCWRTHVAAILFAITALLTTAAHGQDRARLAKAITRALAYDGNLVARAGPSVSMAVLYRTGDAASQREAEAWHEQFRQLTSLRILGLPFESLLLGFRSPGEFRNAIVEKGIDAVFVCSGLEKDLIAIQKVTRERKVTSVASREEQVTEGLSLGVFPVDSRAVLFVNLSAAKEEGAAFSGDMLKLAKIVR
jgi:hypothetical protein